VSGFFSTFPWDGRFYYDCAVYLGDLFTCLFVLAFLLILVWEHLPGRK